MLKAGVEYRTRYIQTQTSSESLGAILVPIGIRQHCHVRKCLWGFIYLFCIFFTACNENSQEYKLKQLYHVLSLRNKYT